MSAAPQPTSEGAVFGPLKFLWLLPILVSVQIALDVFILSRRDWWLFADDAPLADVGLALVGTIVRVWVFSRLLHALISAPTLTVERDALLVRVADGTRTFPWNEIRGWSLTNGGRFTFHLATERVLVNANAVKDVGLLIARLVRHIGQPRLELGLTPEVARRIDGSLALCLIALHAVLAREHILVFAFTLVGCWSVFVLALVLSRPRAVAAWAHSWSPAFLIALTVSVTTRPRYQADPESAALTAIGAGLLSVFAALAFGLAPRAPREVEEL